MLTALAFLTGFAGLLVLALVRHPIFGLYAYLATFYIHPPSRWWAQNLPDLRWAFVAAAVTFVAILIHRGKLNALRTAWWATLPGATLVAFVVWLWIQSLWVLDAEAHHGASIQFTKYLIAFYFFYRLADTPERIRDMLLVHVGGCAYLGLLAYLSDNYVDGRLNGVGGPGIDDANTLGMFLGTGVVVAGMLALVERGWRRVFCILAAAVIFNGVVLAASRGAFLGVLVGGVVLLLVRPLEHRWLFWCLAVVGAAGAVSLMDQRFVERVLSITDAVEKTEQMDDSAESRWVIAAAQLKMFADHPFGTGHKGTAFLSPHYLEEKWLTRGTGGPDAQPIRSSHNTFLTLLVEQSIPGVIAYVLLLAWGGRAIVRIRRLRRAATDPHLGYAGAAAAALGVVFAAGIFTDYLMAEVQIWMLALLAGALAHMLTADAANRSQSRWLAPSLSAKG
jgi:O-antigen ligase